MDSITKIKTKPYFFTLQATRTTSIITVGQPHYNEVFVGKQNSHQKEFKKENNEVQQLLI